MAQETVEYKCQKCKSIFYEPPGIIKCMICGHSALDVKNSIMPQIYEEIGWNERS